MAIGISIFIFQLIIIMYNIFLQALDRKMEPVIMKKLLALLIRFYVLTIFLSSCAVGPDYTKPTNTELNIPAKWHTLTPHNGSNMQLINWWKQFNDPTLEILIESALQTNPSIYEALAKIQQAQANLSAYRSYLFPSITATGSASVSKNSMTSFSTGTTTSSGASGDIFSNNGLSDGASAGMNMSWEIDLFGANRRAIEASQARYLASKLDWNDARVTLAAQVADTYVSLRECQNLLITYREENKSRTATQHITQLRVNSGFAPRTDANQANGSLFQNNASLAQQQSVCGQYQNQLIAQSGIKYDEIQKYLMANYGVIPMPKTTVISLIPATIINQRPDVASAERSLAAANADLGVAIANRYPQITLTGTITANTGSLYAGQPTSWSLGPQITLPIMDGGYLRAQESLNYAKYKQAYATYRKKVINAVQEIENALVRINSANLRVSSAEAAEKNYQEYFDAYNQKYNSGWVNLLDLEVVRVTLLSSKETLAAARLEQVEAWIALYKAVGGGWTN